MSKIDEILVKSKAKEEPYKVPEGYFEDFEARLNAKLDAMEAGKATVFTAAAEQPAEEKSESKKTGLWLRVKPLLYVAASIMLLYGATYVIVQPKVNQAIAETAELETREQVNEAVQEYEDFYQYFVEDEDCEEDDIYEFLSYTD